MRRVEPRPQPSIRGGFAVTFCAGEMGTPGGMGTMALRRAVAALALPLMLAACLHDPHQLSSTYLDRYAEPNPVPADFRECHGFACSEFSRVSLSPHEWKRVTAVFSPRPRDAKAERRQI